MKLDHVSETIPEGSRQKASRAGVEQIARPSTSETSGTAGSGAPAPTAQPAVTVNLSPQVEKTRQLIKTAQELPDIRQDRVAELRQAIESGTYRPKAEDIASALLQAETKT